MKALTQESDNFQGAGDGDSVEIDWANVDQNSSKVRFIYKEFANINNLLIELLLKAIVPMNKIGVNHVGISSDFDGGGGVDGWQDASETHNVTSELRNRGYSEAEIAKLWGGNLMRVLDEVQNIAEQMQKGEL